LVAIAFFLFAASAARAQGVQGLRLPFTTTPNPTASVRQDGQFEIAPITLDGAWVFRIAAPMSSGPDRLPIGVRASYIQSTLAQLTATTISAGRSKTVYDPASITVNVHHDRSQTVLDVVDAHHHEPLPVLTVTAADAQYHRMSVAALAARWQGRLQGVLRAELEKRQPAEIGEHVNDVLRVGGALVVVSLFAWYAIVRLRRRADELEERVVCQEAERDRVEAANESAALKRRRFLALALRATSPAQRLTFYHAIVGTILWLVVLGWFLAATWALALFPQTTGLSQRLSHTGNRIAEIWLMTGLLNRLLDVVIARMGTVWRMTRFSTSEDRARQHLRIPTVARALAGFKTFILIFLAALATLATAGIPIGSVVTIGGISALAISLAAQNFVRDFVNGFLVLFEDQYVVGDYVTINGHSGLVERLNLRMVQLRDGSGNLITIPHSIVAVVINQSRNWSRVDYRVPVDPRANLPRAVDVVRSAIVELAAKDGWRDAVLNPIEWIGVDTITRDYAVIRASTKIQPLRQFEFRREINAHVSEAFVREGIGFGGPIVEAAPAA
jgi:small conductance mechanosensitive channel